MKKAILIGIIGFSLASFGFAATAFAYDYYDPCMYYGCTDPMSGIWNQNYNDNYSWNETINTNINDISIGGGFGGGYYDGGSGSYDYPQCDDGRDNDGDGRVDYPSDSGCSSYNDDTERSGSNNNYLECDDNRDNDGDGDYDYPEDRGCSSYSDDSEDSDDNDRNQCDDNRDNDGDGDVDYPEDRGCTSRNDDSENSDRNDRYECDDNRDNDGDGDYDYPEDRGCTSRSDDSEDSDDNDNDDKPEVTTRDASSISATSATLNGRVDGNGSNTRVWFEYSDTRSDISGDEETDEDSVGSGTTTFNDRITGLRRNTTYYFRAVARNGDGEDRGSILSFRTDDSGNDNDDPECDDNRDNDRDGDEDYPEDRGCSSRNDDSEDSDDRDDDDRNIPPFYTSTPATSVVAGQMYSYNADAISPNGRSITYSLPTRPSGMTINEFTGQVLWLTNLSQAGTSHAVRVVAEDSNGNTVTQTFSLIVRSPIVNPPVYPPVNPPVNPPVQQLQISGLRVNEVNGEVIVSFNTNISARGSARYGTVSELEKDEDFTYPFGQISESGSGTSHEVNLGPLTPNQMYYIRAFATAGSRSDVSPEFAFMRNEAEVVATEEVAGTASCSDGIDNDRDGVADAADSDCDEQASGQVNGTFASALESFGAFLISPWFLILVIIVLIIYIVLTRHEHEVVDAHAPIEIKS